MCFLDYAIPLFTSPLLLLYYAWFEVITQIQSDRLCKASCLAGVDEPCKKVAKAIMGDRSFTALS